MSVTAAGNFEFKRNYGRCLCCSFLIAIIAHFLIFYFSPSFEFKPYVLTDDLVTAMIPPPIIEVPPPPKDIPQPVIPVPVENGGVVDDDVNIPATSPASIGGLQAPPLLNPARAPVFIVQHEPPVLTRFVRPEYPELARQAGIEGMVLLEVLVGKDGRVLEVGVIESDVTPAMEKAAVRAAHRFLFRPARQGTFPVEVKMNVPISFKLH